MKIAMGLAAMVVLMSASRSPVISTERSARQERCDLLLDQLDKASRSSVTYQDAKSVDRLRNKAIHFCSRNKESQGVRAFSKALAILGLKPVDTIRNRSIENPKEMMMKKTLLAALVLSLPMVMGAPLMTAGAANAATAAHKVASPAKKKPACKATKTHACKKAVSKKAAKKK